MQLEHEFRVPVPVAQAWDVLLDVERIAPCMPGATVESFDGETIDGRVKVKVGPIQVTYSRHRAVHREGRGGPAGGHRGQRQGGARRGHGQRPPSLPQLQDDGGSSTNVTVTTDLAITGKPAQFGRGVMVEVGNKLLGRFADCLADELGSGDRRHAVRRAGRRQADAGCRQRRRSAAPGSRPPPRPRPSPRPPTGTPTPQPDRSPAPTPLRRPVENEAIDLLDTAGLPVLKRVAPVLVGLVVLFVFWRLVRRR